MTENKKELELYIHIPFCKRKCSYCDFLSAPGTDEEMEQYVNALVKEIRLHKKMAKAYLVCSIFVGGGTPSILSTSLFSKIMLAVYDTFYILDDAEITIECNPGTVDAAKIKRYKELGINRISIGLQSTHDYELRAVGRIHTYEEFLDCYYGFRAMGFDNINIDLMAALPNQGLDSYKESLERVISLRPEHISAYSLILEEGTPLLHQIETERKKGIETLPSEEVERKMYELTEQMLLKEGYHRYEISNYAKEGRECRHNVGYWRRVSYLGLGLGSSSLVEESRFSKIRDLNAYIQKMDQEDAVLADICENITPLSVKEQMEEFMFLGMRMMSGVSKKAFKEAFGYSIEEVYGKPLLRLDIEELIEQDDDRIWLTKHGIDVSNSVLCEFLIDEETQILHK